MNALGPLRPVDPATSGQNIKPLQPGQKTDGGSFKEMLGEFVGEVDDAQKTAESTVTDFATGKIDNVHDVMISMGKAEVSFKFMMEVRSRLLDAYNEIMRMPI